MPKRHSYRTKSSTSTPLLIFWILFVLYVILGLFDLIRWKVTAADSFTAALFYIILIIMSRRYKFNTLNAVLFGIVFIPNTVGHLFHAYSWAILNGHWDWFVHVVNAFAATVAITSFLLLNSLCRKFLNAAFIAFVVVISAGAFVEASEYWGFIFFGFGEGFLGFGAGDNSHNFGPWENSSIDTTNNFIGAALGMLLSGLFITERHFSRRRKRKKESLISS